jgi:type 1 glutamine amidotransferase
MKRLAFLPALTVFLATGAVLAQPPEQHRDIRVLLTYGGHDFQEKEFFAMWDALPGVRYTKAPLPESAGLLQPGLEKDYDVIVSYDMSKGLTAEQQKSYEALLESGIGLVALHHNLGAHPDWPEYRKVIGAKWVFEPETIDGKDYAPSTYAHDQEIPVSIADPDHFITKGLADFVIHDETYGGAYVSPDVHVLLKARHPGNVEPFAWTTGYGKSRVVYFMAGHDDKGWANPAFPEVLSRSIRWAARRD